MANEYVGTMIDVDESGNERTLYPKTTIAAVAGLQSALDNKAAKEHEHDASDIKTGVLSVERGGTGASSVSGAKSALGLDKVENKSSEDIRKEITKEDISDALGYTPVDPSESTSITVDSALSDTSTNPVQNKVVKEALDTHKHDASDIKSGVLSVERGGTGASTAAAAVTALGAAKNDLSNVNNETLKEKATTAGLAASDLSNVDNSVLAEKIVESGAGGTPIVTAESTDGVAYTATVPGVTELTDGLQVRILPSIVSSTTSPTLDVNGLGAIRIGMLSSFNNAAVVPAPIAAWLSAMRPVTLTFHQMRSTVTGNVTNQYWIVDWRRPSASSLYGQTPVQNGGWYINANTTDENKAEALAALKEIGVAEAGHSHAWSAITDKPSSFTPASHNHSTADITSGTLPVARGGTGVTDLASLATALGAAKIQTGSYTGTDKYGSSNPNTLTFNFVPKVVVVQIACDYGYNYTSGYIFVNGQQYATSTESGITIQVSWSGNSISFYSKDKSEYQMNEDKEYRYFAIG